MTPNDVDRILQVIDDGLAAAPSSDTALYLGRIRAGLCWRCQTFAEGEGSGLCDACRTELLDETTTARVPESDVMIELRAWGHVDPIRTVWFDQAQEVSRRVGTSLAEVGRAMNHAARSFSAVFEGVDLAGLFESFEPLPPPPVPFKRNAQRYGR